MIYNLMKRIITTGMSDTETIQKQLDVYFAFGRLTADEYTELVNMIMPRDVEGE